MFKPRPMQAEVLRYRQGKMGISAVPGSGKTLTLSYLAALLISEGHLEAGQEVLIVTLVNSAVDNFTNRIQSFLREYGILPGMGYRVRTLHGLANDITRERPDLVGLSDRFEIVDERESTELLEAAAVTWIRSHPDFVESFTKPDLETDQNYRIARDWQRLVIDVAGSFIHLAKDLQQSPAGLQTLMAGLKTSHPLLEMGLEIYHDYQRALNYRGAVDFDDLIRLALLALRADPDYLARLRYRWVYILEDEAQDSSRLQEDILRLLAGADGNWVRVGDPNQAIYETFTTANPGYLLNFMREPGVVSRALPNSGRSSHTILKLANHLIHWTRTCHPNLPLRDALTLPFIEPAPAGDPQPNPADNLKGVIISPKKFTPDQELKSVASSLKVWVRTHPEETVAALVPRNERGSKLVTELKNAGLEVVELLRSSVNTRSVASVLSAILSALADAASTPRLAALYREVCRQQADDPERASAISACHTALRGCLRVEDYLYPRPDRDWLSALEAGDHPPVVIKELSRLRAQITRWQEAILLPIDQLILTISQELYHEPADLALAHKLALMLERAARVHPEWQLADFSAELQSIAQNQRKFLGFTEEDTGFNPDQHRGKVVVATIHKAKGLEWDRVYLLSGNNYDFPSAEPHDHFISERWFVRDQLNLQAETLSKLKALVAGDIAGGYLEAGEATRASRCDYASERLRLLYVGITRARKELIITWNTGRNGDNIQAVPLAALKDYLEEMADGAQP